MKPDLLKGKIKAYHLTNAKVGECIGKSESYVRGRVKSPSRFELAEVYTLCELLEISYSEIPQYFPRRENL